MAFRLPFRSLASKIQAAARENSPSLWHTVGSLVDRNFSAIEQWTQSTDALPNKRVFTVIPAALRQTASATFVDWPVGQALSGTFVKKVEGSRLIVTLVASAFVTGGAGTVDYGVNVDGDADSVLKNGWGGNTDTVDHTGVVELSGVSAGEHTINLRARVGAGLTLNTDVNDQVSIIVEEVA